MMNYRGWDDLTKRARTKDLNRIKYDSEGATPFYEPYSPILREAIRDVAKYCSPDVVISLGEGHHPRIWAGIDAWVDSRKMDDNRYLKRLICIDPIYANSDAARMYIDEFSKTFYEAYAGFLPLPVLKEAEPGVFTQEYSNMEVRLITGKVPLSPTNLETLQKATGGQAAWLNIINLLNYLSWEDFVQTAELILPSIRVVSFANKVNADRELIDNWMNPDRLKDNQIFIDWIKSKGFEEVWAIEGFDGGSTDLGAIYIRKDLET